MLVWMYFCKKDLLVMIQPAESARKTLFAQPLQCPKGVQRVNSLLSLSFFLLRKSSLNPSSLCLCHPINGIRPLISFSESSSLGSFSKGFCSRLHHFHGFHWWSCLHCLHRLHCFHRWTLLTLLSLLHHRWFGSHRRRFKSQPVWAKDNYSKHLDPEFGC